MDDRKLNGVLIGDRERREVWKNYLKSISNIESLKQYTLSDFLSFDSVEALFDSSNHSFIILPLTLTRFNSLRIAEYCHKNNIQTRIILVSGTYTNK